MAKRPGDEREGLLDPVDRISEILFGLIMAVTGSPGARLMNVNVTIEIAKSSGIMISTRRRI